MLKVGIFDIIIIGGHMGEKKQILSVLEEIATKLQKDEARADILEFIDCKIKDIENSGDVASEYIEDLVSNLK